jgi:hypothetical protein
MDYQKLFSHLSQEHGLILLQTEMQEIVSIVNEIQDEALRQSCVVGQREQYHYFKLNMPNLAHRPCKQNCGDEVCQMPKQ